MSKKDYVLIAETLSEYQFTDPQDKINLSNRFASALSATSPSFNRQRFLDAAIHNEYRNTKGHGQTKD